MQANPQWILTATGGDYPLNTEAAWYLPDAPVPNIECIAHSLAQINRYTGHACRPYSVAEHSMLVCAIVAQMGLGCHAQLAALMHDAHECITGDVASPIKAVLGVAWQNFENFHAHQLRKHYLITSAFVAHKAAIKRADLIALALERRHLMNFDADSNLPWPVIDEGGIDTSTYDFMALAIQRRDWPWETHKRAFLATYKLLELACNPPINATTPATTEAP